LSRGNSKSFHLGAPSTFKLSSTALARSGLTRGHFIPHVGVRGLRLAGRGATRVRRTLTRATSAVRCDISRSRSRSIYLSIYRSIYLYEYIYIIYEYGRLEFGVRSLAPLTPYGAMYIYLDLDLDLSIYLSIYRSIYMNVYIYNI